jgi:hypothetical protein
MVVCLKSGTPLARRAARFPYVDFVELSPPTERDGFLATNFSWRWLSFSPARTAPLSSMAASYPVAGQSLSRGT